MSKDREPLLLEQNQTEGCGYKDTKTITTESANTYKWHKIKMEGEDAMLDNTKDTAAASIQKDIIEPHADATSSRKRSASDLSDCSAGSAAKLSSVPKKRVALRHLLSASEQNDDGCQNGEGGAGLVEKPMETYYDEDVKEGSQKDSHSCMSKKMNPASTKGLD